MAAVGVKAQQAGQQPRTNHKAMRFLFVMRKSHTRRMNEEQHCPNQRLRRWYKHIKTGYARGRRLCRRCRANKYICSNAACIWKMLAAAGFGGNNTCCCYTRYESRGGFLSVQQQQHQSRTPKLPSNMKYLVSHWLLDGRG